MSGGTLPGSDRYIAQRFAAFHLQHEGLAELHAAEEVQRIDVVAEPQRPAIDGGDDVLRLQTGPLRGTARRSLLHEQPYDAPRRCVRDVIGVAEAQPSRRTWR